MSVLQKLFHHPMSADPQTPAPAPLGERRPPPTVAAEPMDDLTGFLDAGDAPLHDPGEPPNWAPECGTPSFSTRHRCGG